MSNNRSVETGGRPQIRGGGGGRGEKGAEFYGACDVGGIPETFYHIMEYI